MIREAVAVLEADGYFDCKGLTKTPSSYQSPLVAQALWEIEQRQQRRGRSSTAAKSADAERPVNTCPDHTEGGIEQHGNGGNGVGWFVPARCIHTPTVEGVQECANKYNSKRVVCEPDTRMQHAKYIEAHPDGIIGHAADSEAVDQGQVSARAVQQMQTQATDKYVTPFTRRRQARKLLTQESRHASAALLINDCGAGSGL